MSGDMARIALRLVERHNARAWPSTKWAADPVGFMRTFLAFDPWEKQREIAEMVRDNPRVAVASGHRIGKTELCAALAIWFYCCFRDARVILLGPTANQIDGAVYRAVKKLWLQSGRCVDCARLDDNGPRPCTHSALLAGEVHASSDHGVKSSNDLREIRGVNVRAQEAAQGIAGENILMIADEASGEYLDRIMGALTGNRAGGAKMIEIGNPIRAVGEFADAWGSKADFYATLRVSSEESPNVKAGREVIKGLATRDWIEEQTAEYGRTSPFFLMRVLGRHITTEEGAIFPAELLEARAIAWGLLRHPETGTHYETPQGPLVIALDPAGDSGTGDDSVFIARRGFDVLELYARKGLTPEAHLTEVLGLISRYRRDPEIVYVVQDAAGDVGARVRGTFIAYQSAHLEASKHLAIRFVQSGKRAERDPLRYQQVRDEMCAACLDWLQGGGCIPDHAKLKFELSRFAWVRHVSDRAKATSKDGPGGIREQIGRSPGFADALMLCSWARGDAAPIPAAAPPTPTTPSAALDQLQRGAGLEHIAHRDAPKSWNPYDALSQFYRPKRR